MLRKWEELPEFMRCAEVKEYYDLLYAKRSQLKCKRFFDLFIACGLLILLAIPMLVIGVLIKVDSSGPIIYRQERVTAYGKKYRIHKFRTMVNDAEKIGTSVTVHEDVRVTKMGHILRKFRIDEIPQLIDVIVGDMSFVGTRPEVTKYVKMYTKEMCATLLLPAGITSEASIRYKEEALLLENADDADKVYIEDILPEKMKYNLQSIKDYSILNDWKTMFRTVLSMLGRKYE